MSTLSSPDRLQAVLQDKYKPEAECVAALIADPPYSTKAAKEIQDCAVAWIERVRAEPDRRTLLDSFLSEYGLSNEEGVALMCLAEAYLRIPDSENARKLIVEKLGEKDWAAHLGQADSWLVNSSTWALMLTGKTLKLGRRNEPENWIEEIIRTLGLPVVQAAVGTAMQILGGEFVLGETIKHAIRNAETTPNTTYSFDMLGEGARDQASADAYLAAYERAIEAVAEMPRASVSIKLSALHPRYEPLQDQRVIDELGLRLVALAEKARGLNVAISIDAEEADRLLLSLNLFERVAVAVPGWSGLGFVVQGYGKCAREVIDWLAELARRTSRTIPVRLVKGAYWDLEIKRAQERGLDEFPVYTRKNSTDAAYLSCAKQLLGYENQLYPQFATHNAHTLSAVIQMAGTRAFECQRLHGMGAHLYEVASRDHPNLHVRIYAPVGEYKDLLAYLVRRLLENGANSSFVNKLHSDEESAIALAKDPFAALVTYQAPRHAAVKLPAELYGDRRNSSGVDFSIPLALAATLPVPEWELETVQTTPLQTADDLMSHAAKTYATWHQSLADERIQVLENLADLIQSDQTLINLLCHEAGKCIGDVTAEIREAVDFCRYYAAQARALLTIASLPGPTGETNELFLQGRGTFVCISPWNFPLAIFTGQIAAALVCGNTVVAKPAETTPRIALHVQALLRQAGLPDGALQIAVGGAELGQALVEHRTCSGVAFTGSTIVSQIINRTLAQRDGPIVPLIAETGGINAMLVDSSALKEQVTDDLLQSAFLSAGQRCSSVRLLLLQQEVAEEMISLIKGAMQELQIGDPADPATDVGPIITETAAEKINTHIDEARAAGLPVFQPYPPQRNQLTPRTVLPTLIEIPEIAWLKNEVFGPVVHVVRFAIEDLETLIEEVNNLGYGLTFGVHSRLSQRAHRIGNAVNAGNVYINRNTTGAVVGTQPFGGYGLSGTGPKAGGPNYLKAFCRERTITDNVAALGGNLALLTAAAELKKD